MSAIKNWLKKFFPSPAEATNQRFDQLERLLDRQNSWLGRIENELQIDKRLNELRSELVAIDEKSRSLLYKTGVNNDKIEVLQGLVQSNMLKDSVSYERSFLYQYIKKVRSRFSVVDVSGGKNRFIRIGKPNDGGYIMLNDFSESKIAYSFGIADDVSWDRDMADRGLQVFMYDHTIEGLPETHYNFHFFKVGLTGTYSEQKPELKTLEMLLEENGHSQEHNMILKIDIEGYEWGLLNHIGESTLNHFSQIVFEFHHLINPNMEGEIIPALEKLNRTHQLVHLHANNYGAYLMLNGKVLPELLEGTYLRKDLYSFQKSNRFFPTKLDHINNVRRPEIVLGQWN